MARFFKKKDDDKKKKRGGGLFKRRKFCRFTAEKVEQIDYKDVDVLKEYIQENAKIMPACLTSMVKANCLIDIPVEVERLNPGDPVTVQLLSGSVWLDQAAPAASAAHRPSCC